MSLSIKTIGIIGTGVMGTGIAQIASQAGIRVFLYDSRDNAAMSAKVALESVFNRLIERGKIIESNAQQYLNNLSIAEHLRDLSSCDLIIEAIIENLDIKKSIFKELEAIVPKKTILATNTSSLSVSAIASSLQYPDRMVGFHFFNPVPLMKVVEIIPGFKTNVQICVSLKQLAEKMGHTGVYAKDTPGFIVNHVGRAYTTEALRILGEGIATVGEIDRVLREAAGFRMGPFELLDLTSLDVSHPAMEAIYHQFYEEPRCRPHPLTQQMMVAGLLGRKSNEGFYRYDKGVMLNPSHPQPIPHKESFPPIWIGAESEDDRAEIISLIATIGSIIVEDTPYPSDEAICLLAPLGEDATAASIRFEVDPKKTVCIDLMCDLSKHRVLMTTPVTDIAVRECAHAFFAQDGVEVTVIQDSTGFIAQRVLAAIVNLSCDVAQQKIATTEDIDLAVKLGLGYPYGPLRWGDILGRRRILTILERMSSLLGDPRYRPSPWLRRRTQLGVSLHHTECMICRE